MEGKRNPNDMRGIIPNAFNHIFGFIDQKEESMQYLIRIA
jgi:hypothetical protein